MRAPVIANKFLLRFPLFLVFLPSITRLLFAISNRKTTRNLQGSFLFIGLGTIAHTNSDIQIHIYLSINNEYARHVNSIYNPFYLNEESVFFCFHSHSTTLLYYIFSFVFFCSCCKCEFPRFFVFLK